MHLVEAMLQGTPARVKQRLAEAGADIAIIGRRQVHAPEGPPAHVQGFLMRAALRGAGSRGWVHEPT